MAKADSVFMSVTNELQEGSILIKHLEEIFQHENQFVFIWELSKCAALRWPCGFAAWLQ